MLEHKLNALATVLGVVLVNMIPNWLWLILSSIATGACIWIGQALARWFVTWCRRRLMKDTGNSDLPEHMPGSKKGKIKTKLHSLLMKKFIFMAALAFLVIHCTATPAGREVSRQDIEQWHLVQRGWHQVGYADMIHLNGTIENLVPYNRDNNVDSWEITNGVAGINYKSRHVVYVGGCNAKMEPLDTRTDKQKQALYLYVLATIKEHPNIVIAGHNQFDKKACPSFDVQLWLRNNGIPERNIYTPPKTTTKKS
jgi:hypothetical protein